MYKGKTELFMVVMVLSLRPLLTCNQGENSVVGFKGLAPTRAPGWHWGDLLRFLACMLVFIVFNVFSVKVSP